MDSIDITGETFVFHTSDNEDAIEPDEIVLGEPESDRLPDDDFEGPYGEPFGGGPFVDDSFADAFETIFYSKEYSDFMDILRDCLDEKAY